MSRIAVAAIVFTLLVSACVAEDGVAGNGGFISEQDALRIASAEAERMGWEQRLIATPEQPIPELRSKAVREGDFWQVDFFPTNGQLGGGGRVVLRAKNGEVFEVNPWR